MRAPTDRRRCKRCFPILPVPRGYLGRPTGTMRRRWRHERRGGLVERRVRAQLRRCLCSCLARLTDRPAGRAGRQPRLDHFIPPPESIDRMQYTPTNQSLRTLRVMRRQSRWNSSAGRPRGRAITHELSVDADRSNSEKMTFLF